MSKVILFGAGNYARECWKKKNENTEIYCDDYLAFCDNNERLWGSYFDNKKIIAPQDIKLYDIDLIVITSTYSESIYKQLTEELHIPEDQICVFTEYTCRCYTRWIYRKQYGSGDTGENKKAEIGKLVVYTAIIGKYDELKDPMLVDEDITYVCFTNTPSLRSDIWNIEYIQKMETSDVLTARSIKIQPHIYFPEFEFSVWVDGKFRINGDMREYIGRYLRESAMLCFPHYARQCIYDEGGACIFYNKGDKEDIIRQMSFYYEEKYPFNNGLYETGCLVRRHQDDFCKKIMNEWMWQVQKYSIRDQISLPYVFWKNSFRPDISDLYISKNKWLTSFPHAT